MTKEEVNKLYLKIILEYGIKTSAEYTLANALVSEPSTPLSDRQIILSKMIESGKISHILNHVYRNIAYAEALTSDHLIDMLVVAEKELDIDDWFSGNNFNRIINMLNEDVDFETNKIKQSITDKIIETEVLRAQENEYWEKVRRGQIVPENFDSVRVGDGSTELTISSDGSIMVVDFNEVDD